MSGVQNLAAHTRTVVPEPQLQQLRDSLVYTFRPALGQLDQAGAKWNRASLEGRLAATATCPQVIIMSIVF